MTTVSRDVASGMNSATVPGSRSASGGSISTAVMVAPVSKIANVKMCIRDRLDADQVGVEGKMPSIGASGKPISVAS